eukprot:CAMPEP_0181325602 /NCGR_PEP_ID=MMETSP1101-20121128/21023_1 /TAXON_ID=46948 /ORGANISM="Rhodomonas abbreviata, Strain Caron Lab Isolate" /LENGTH=251 /DNA_ID=CAMNT_0023433941 /DNA_START=309 /DNA_END=1060 /DNA_ORIENTATION=+
MARAGKKCMFEDDVRQLLGMPQPLESKVVADTSLEKSFSVHGKHSNVSRQMDDRGGKNGGDAEPSEGFGFGRLIFASRRLIISVLLVGLLGLGIVLMVDEMHQTSRRQLAISYRTKGFHPRRSSSSGGLWNNDQTSSSSSLSSSSRSPAVVTKDNWKTLQDKADRFRSMHKGKGAGSSAAAAAAAAAAHVGSAKKSLEAELGSLAWSSHKGGGGGSTSSSSSSAAAGGWASIHGGPHSGARGGTLAHPGGG